MKPSDIKDRNRLRRATGAERRVAIDNAGRRTAGSGNQPSVGQKGDVKAADWLFEVKDAVGPRYSITLLTWRTIECQAIRASKEPALVLNLAGRKLVIVSYDAFLALSAGAAGSDET